MHAHGVEIFDGADDDAVILAVAHHLHFEFLPTEHRLFQEHLVGWRGIQTALADVQELLAVVGDTAAAAAEGEGWPQNGREADVGLHLACRFQIVHQHRTRRVEPDARHGAAKELAILGLVDGFPRGADHLNAEGREHPFPIQIQRAVERRLPAHRGQQRLRALLFDNLRERTPVNGLDVGGIGHIGIGHDGGGVRVGEHDPIALLAQRLAGLRPGVIELAGLADDDGPGADDEHALDVAAFRHPQLPVTTPGAVTAALMRPPSGARCARCCRRPA